MKLPKRLDRVQLVLGLVTSVAVLALGGRFALYAGGLWRDEVHTVHLASKSWSGLIALLDRDSAPLFFVSLVKLWMAWDWPDQDAAIRLLGFLFTVAMIAVLWIGARVLGMGPPLLSLTLFAAHGTVIQTVSSAKSYGFSALPALGAFAALLKMAEKPTPGAFLAAALLSVLTAQTSYSTVPIVVTVAAVVALFTLRTDWRRAALIATVPVLTLLSLLPYAGVIARSRSWRPITETDLPPWRMFELLWQGVGSSNPFIAAVSVVAVGVTAYAAVRHIAGTGFRDTVERRPIVALVAGAMAWLGFMLFMALAQRPPQPWHWVPAIGVLVFSADVALARMPSFAWARVGLAIVAALAVVPPAVVHVSARQTNVDQVARYLETAADRHDLIIVNPWYVGITFGRYYGGPTPWTTIPPMSDITTHRYDLLKTQLMAPAPLGPMHAEIVKTLRAGHRVWVVGSHDFVEKGAAPPTLPPAPNGPWGWKDGPYRMVWSLQTGHLLQNSALYWKILTPPADRPVMMVEFARVIAIEGWRQ